MLPRSFLPSVVWMTNTKNNNHGKRRKEIERNRHCRQREEETVLPGMSCQPNQPTGQIAVRGLGQVYRSLPLLLQKFFLRENGEDIPCDESRADTKARSQRLQETWSACQRRTPGQQHAPMARRPWNTDRSSRSGRRLQGFPKDAADREGKAASSSPTKWKANW